MGLTHSPKIVTSNLLLNLDFANVKNFNGAENLLKQSQAISLTSPWAYGYHPGGTLTPTLNNAMAPDGTITATLITNDYKDNSFIQDVTASGTGTYTMSLYVKGGTSTSAKLTYYFLGSPSVGGSVTFNPITGVISAGGVAIRGSIDCGNGWYRIWMTFTGPSASFTQLRFECYCDIGTMYVWGAQIEKGAYLNSYTATTSTAISRPTSVTSTISSYSLARTNSSNFYAQYNNGVMNFTRAATADNTNKDIAADNFQATITQANLKPPTFLYNDFTWEIWFKINDINPANYDATENISAIMEYRGWHQGFEYTDSLFSFRVLNNTGPTYDSITTTIGISSGNIRQGNWHQVAVTRSGSLYTMYVNGVSVNTKTMNLVAISEGVYTSNQLNIGGNKNAGALPSGSYFWHSKMDFACANMYNRALTADEISQNFAALRGRFGI